MRLSTQPGVLSPFPRISLCFLATPAPRHRRATMPPRRRGASGYRSVHQCANGWYYTEIRSGNVRLGLSTFETMHEAARTYDAAVWRLYRPRAQMNFQDVYTRQQVQDVAPPPRLITD
ncbi:ethylene-responsive transcription factor ERF109-like [Aegilops tauschii subsp. strangulata]|uniref:ethylene-responsive transcription factor ERF109-like n=1 Tax=Aegilops tauschii subsp. strangulata TaxID=200361 RepID=UPI00098B0588|nr:ethylene-responsive transcription factor ERF109-like [Aegilops tauschii subsp. strangulata]